MNKTTHWILALLLLATGASFAAPLRPQEPPKPEVQKPQKLPKQPKPQQQQQKSSRAERQKAMQDALATMKTGLGEAIGLAEKQTTGKAFSAGVEITKGKASIEVHLFVGEKLNGARGDPETK